MLFCCCYSACRWASNNQYVGCCEAPVVPIDTCPPGFSGPDASGWCYSIVSGGATGINWAQARDACRARGYDAQLATILDANTQASLIGPGGRCGGQATRTYWLGW